ncbi:MAG: hypothetical protein ACNS63_08425 [Candidatus Nitrospinota bacterium M3_3B_026]
MRNVLRPGEIILVFILFTAASLVYSWPLPERLFDAIPYAYNQDPARETAFMFQGDHLQAYYHFRLLKDAFLGQIEFFSNPYEFSTEHQLPLPSTHFLPLSVLYLPFSFISGVLAYNVFLLMAFAAGGLAMYLWAKELTGSRIGALVAATVFNFVPLRQVELFGGHPSGHAIFLFPLTLFFFDRAVRLKSVNSSAMGGLCALVLALQYNFFSYFLLMFLMAYIPWRLAPAIAKALRSGMPGVELSRLMIAGVPFAAGILAAIGWMLYFKTKIVSGAAFESGRTMGEVALFSPPLSAAWDPVTNWSVYLGIPFAAAAAAAAWIPFGLVKKRKGAPDAIFFLAVFALTYFLAFGATLNGAIPLYSLFYDHFPYFNLSRSPVKIMVITVSALAVLAAIVTAAAMRAKKPAAALILGLTALAAVDYHSGRGVGLCLLDRDNKVYERIARTKDAKVLNVPIWPGESSWSSIYQYYAVESATPMINGYTPLVSKSYIDNVFWPLFPVNSGDITGDQARLMKKMGVTHVVFHEEAYPPKVSAYPQTLALERLAASPYLDLVERKPPLTLLKLSSRPRNGEAAPLFTSPIGHMIQAESLHRRLGTPVDDPAALNGVALAAPPATEGDGDGVINAGPYMTFPAGAYRAVFRLKVDDNSLPGLLAGIDVAGDEGRIILAERKIAGAGFAAAGEYQEFTLEYSLEPGQPWQVEFRAHVIGETRVWFDSVYVLFADRSDPAWEYEAEEMFYTGGIEHDAEAGDGKAVISIPGRDPADMVIRGPGRILSAGDYTARFRMKTSGAGDSSDTVAWIEARSASSGKALGRRAVMAQDMPGEWEYGDAALPFSIPEDDAVEFYVISTGAARLTVDGFRIESVAR